MAKRKNSNGNGKRLATQQPVDHMGIGQGGPLYFRTLKAQKVGPKV
jgi:hypothetical protein